MSTATASALASIADIHEARFDRALVELQAADPTARVALDQKTGLALGVDAVIQMEMPPAASTLLASDRSAAASVMFLDQYGALFGIAGWHSLEPQYASPLGEAIWFTFAASTHEGDVMVNVCTKDETILHVRVG